MGPRKKIAAVSVSGIAGLLIAYGIAVAPHPSLAPAQSAQGLLDKADALSWTNRWALAQPVYAQAAGLFRQENLPAKVLYAEASELPADESTSVATKILRLNEALRSDAANDPATRLRVLTIKGMLETNYDAGQALSNVARSCSIGYEAWRVEACVASWWRAGNRSLHPWRHQHGKEPGRTRVGTVGSRA